MQEVYYGEIQSGHLEQVGYDTYCNLLDEVVKEMKGIEVTPEVDIQIDLNVTSYIPEEYIHTYSHFIHIYFFLFLNIFEHREFHKLPPLPKGNIFF